MITVSKGQLAQIDDQILVNFSQKMQHSLSINLEQNFADKLPEIKKNILEAIGKLNIKDESNIEDYLLLYYTYPDLQKFDDSNIKRILLSKYKTENTKLEEIKSYCLTLDKL